MPKLVLTDAQMDQIKSMKGEGKSPKEIMAFFKESYQVDLPGWKISYIVGPSKPKKVAKVKKEKKAKSVAAPATGGGMATPGIENAIQDILLILSQIDRGYKAVFKHLRLQLLKKRKEVHQVMRKADIPIEVEDEIPAEEELSF